MFDTNFAGYIDDFVRTGKINTASKMSTVLLICYYKMTLDMIITFI